MTEDIFCQMLNLGLTVFYLVLHLVAEQYSTFYVM